MKTAQWYRAKTGNTALGTLYSAVNEQLLALNITLSFAKIAFPDYEIYEAENEKARHPAYDQVVTVKRQETAYTKKEKG